mmetsp:Transcript_17280/g.25170  ORF Transcript_17280/g.25170 Transcript_17280/m.25170 type:complete len:162 (+) Transcript_17280:130-615(+)
MDLCSSSKKNRGISFGWLVVVKKNRTREASWLPSCLAYWLTDIALVTVKTKTTTENAITNTAMMTTIATAIHDSNGDGNGYCMAETSIVMMTFDGYHNDDMMVIATKTTATAIMMMTIASVIHDGNSNSNDGHANHHNNCYLLTGNSNMNDSNHSKHGYSV